MKILWNYLKRRPFIVDHNRVVAFGSAAGELREILRLRPAEGDDRRLVVGHSVPQLLAEVHLAVHLVEVLDGARWSLFVFRWQRSGFVGVRVLGFVGDVDDRGCWA